MRRAILLGLLAVVALSAGAAKPDAIAKVTVAQLEQALAEASAAHKSDAAIAREIRGMELTERLTEATLERLSANLKAGSKAALALHLLADQSAFLDPPANEMPTTPAPGYADQKQMLDALRNYASQTVLHLPNFLATRTDTRFDNSHRSSDNDAALYRVGDSSGEVSMRNDRQNQATDQVTSWGEFGAMLGMVLNDSARGWVTWSHWEQTPAGATAVFRYFVPKAASHFAVYIPVLNPKTQLNIDPDPFELMKRFGQPEGSLPYDPKLKSSHPDSINNSVNLAKPGYRGLLWMDPSAGTVLRITIEADPSDIAPYERVAMMVQYGPVKIGDGSFTCPVRSLSILTLSPHVKPANVDEQNCLSKQGFAGIGTVGGAGIPDCESEGAGTKAPPTFWLNETLFTGYHRFAATSRILTDAAAPKSEPTHDEGSQPSIPVQESAASTQQAVAPVAAPQPPDHSNATAPAAEQQFVEAPAASSQQASAEPYPAPMLRVNTNLIQLPVLVLSTNREKISKPIASDRFSIGFNGGSPFRPKFVRREGDDPLQLAIFLDVRHPQEALLPKMDETIANLAPAFLHPGDRVSVYAIDCGSLIAVENVPAEPVRLKSAVDTALSRWTARRQLRQKSACVDDAPLWDLLAQVAGRLSMRSGWRAILAVTDGNARKSKRTPRDLQVIAEHDQVAIFALEPSPHSFGSDLIMAQSAGDPIDLALSSVCELSGGTMLSLEITSLAKATQEVIGMLRDRYILEFSRPSELIAGNNVVSVRIDKSSALIRPAGDGVPLTDEAFTANSAPVPASAPPAAQPADNSNAAAPATKQQSVAEPLASTPQAATPVAAPQPEPPPQTPPSVQARAFVEMPPSVAANAPQNTIPTIQVNVNRVLVPVVVRDRQGRTVGDLKQEDFEVFDNNKPRVISAFTIEKREAAEVSAASAAAAGAEPSAAPNAAPAAPAPPRFIVFLFDDRHLTLQNLVYAQKAAVKALDGALSGPSDRAVVLSVSGSANSGLTADRAKLQEAIMAVKSQSISRSTTTGCVKIDDYQADRIVNGNDDAAFTDAVRQYMACNPTTQGECGVSTQGQGPATVHEGSPQIECLKKSDPGIGVIAAARDFLMQSVNSVIDSYSSIGGVLSKLATLPGQRTLILISSGFLNVDPQAQAMESRIIDFAAQSSVTIDALDARGVYITAMSASEDLAGENLVVHDQLRSAAELEADAPMANLADGTGGTFFHHSNDLDAGFKKLTEAPRIVYLLELSLDGVKADGTFHRLKVKVHRDGVDVKARSEFFVPKPAKGE